nr:putative ribonuclease H-like domain-containing protein [Tanacetum cinerariifolium]
HLESSTSNAQDACKADDPESSGNSNPTATSTNPSADQVETLTVETPIPTVSSPILTACLDDSPQLLSDTRLISKRVTSQDDTPSLDNILTLTNRFEDILGVTTNRGDTNRVEADLSNMENNISASPTPTFRIHKDHQTSQIIGPVDTLVQTRNKSKEMEEQSFIASIHHMTNPDLLQKHRGDFILVQVYVDNIIFGSSNPQLCREFEALMHEKFQMSAMGELNFFLGLQVLQKKDGIFLSQDKYVGDILKKFGYSDVRSANTPMDKENP